MPSAFALDAAAQELVFVLGPLVVLLAQLTGAGGGLVAAAVVGLAGTLWFTSSRVSRTWRPPVTGGRHWLGPLRSRRLGVLYASLVFLGATIGVPAVALVAYAESTGHRGARRRGWSPATRSAPSSGASPTARARPIVTRAVTSCSGWPCWW